jgi:hypothetical protein
MTQITLKAAHSWYPYLLAYNGSMRLAKGQFPHYTGTFQDLERERNFLIFYLVLCLMKTSRDLFSDFEVFAIDF